MPIDNNKQDANNEESLTADPMNPMMREIAEKLKKERQEIEEATVALKQCRVQLSKCSELVESAQRWNAQGYPCSPLTFFAIKKCNNELDKLMRNMNASMNKNKIGR